jgi:hypothetical protein
MANKIIGFEILCSVPVFQFFEIPEAYLTDNKEINNLNTEIWVYQGDDSPFDLETEEMYSNFFDMDEADFIKISGFTIDE